MNIKSLLYIIGVFFICLSACNQSNTEIGSLPKPKIEGGKPLMLALKDRATTREFSTKDIPLQQLSNLLWAADGINRPETNGRTAPSGRNKQEIDIYVALKSGVYLYDYNNSALKKIISEDIRSIIGVKDFVKVAPVNLLYVADYNKMGSDKSSRPSTAVDAAYISENVYLFCASENLATVVLGSINANSIAKKIQLKDYQEVMFAQPVGFKK